MPYVPLSLFITGLALGTAVVLSSSHWVFAWMGLEINTLAILPLMARQHHPRAVEATTKYFLIQAAAATTLLFAATTNAWLSGHWDIQQPLHPVPTAIIIVALALKLGVAPLHVWLPEVLQGLDLTTGFLISTWQKIAPLILLMQVQMNLPWPILLVMGLLSALIGGWGGMAQTQIRKILAYSSIAHLGWMVTALQIVPTLTLLAFLVYCLTTSSAFLIFIAKQTTTLNSLAASWTNFPAIAAVMPFTLLSLAGIPPFSGFLPKWTILKQLTEDGLLLVSTLIALSSLLSLLFYLRLIYSIALTIPSGTPPLTINWRFRYVFVPGLIGLTAAGTLLLLPLAPLLVTIIKLPFWMR